MSKFQNLVFLLFFGQIGLLLRFFLGSMLKGKSFLGLPLPLFIINILGCFLIGPFLYLTKNYLGPQWQGILLTGLLGSLTTYSLFISESYQFLHNGNFDKFCLYVFAQISLSLLSMKLGLTLFS